MNCRVWYPSGDSGDLFFLNTQVLLWDVAQERKKAMIMATSVSELKVQQHFHEYLKW